MFPAALRKHHNILKITAYDIYSKRRERPTSLKKLIFILKKEKKRIRSHAAKFKEERRKRERRK